MVEEWALFGKNLPSQRRPWRSETYGLRQPFADRLAAGFRDTASSAPSAETSPGDHTPLKPPLPGWLLKVLGHVLAGVSGLLLGYLYLRWFRPDTLPW